MKTISAHSKGTVLIYPFKSSGMHLLNLTGNPSTFFSTLVLIISLLEKTGSKSPNIEKRVFKRGSKNVFKKQ